MKIVLPQRREGANNIKICFSELRVLGVLAGENPNPEKSILAQRRKDAKVGENFGTLSEGLLKLSALASWREKIRIRKEFFFIYRLADAEGFD